MPLPPHIRKRVDDLLLSPSEAPYDLDPRDRLELYRAFGPSCVETEADHWARVRTTVLPVLTPADRVRARLAKLTAQQVLPLWAAAREETAAHFRTSSEDDLADEAAAGLFTEEQYLFQRQNQPIEHISIYQVPYAYIPFHIMAMADHAFEGVVNDYPAFCLEANECWQLYPRPEGMEREFCIKWAAQDYLYETIAWTKYMYQEPYVVATDQEVEAVDHLEAPAGFGVIAYAGLFAGDRPGVDSQRQREFWQWWLTEAIPQAWTGEAG